MAMKQTVIASAECAAAVKAEIGKELFAAGSALEFIKLVSQLLANSEQRQIIGCTARHRVLADYSWDAHLSAIDRYIAGEP